MTTLTVPFNNAPFSASTVTSIVIFSPGEKVALGPIIVVVLQGTEVTLSVGVLLTILLTLTLAVLFNTPIMLTMNLIFKVTVSPTETFPS